MVIVDHTAKSALLASRVQLTSCPVSSSSSSSSTRDNWVIVAGSSGLAERRSAIHISSGLVGNNNCRNYLEDGRPKRTYRTHTAIITSSVDEKGGSLDSYFTRWIVDTVESAINFMSCFVVRRRQHINGQLLSATNKLRFAGQRQY